MCFAQINNATFRDWFKGEVDYARSKKVGLSGYTLMQHNGWGETIPELEKVLQRDGKTRGPTACFATDWHASYRNAVLDFITYTGMSGLETDGQFEGGACADEGGDHHHNGLAGGYDAQMAAARDFNRDLKEIATTDKNGVYQTGTAELRMSEDHIYLIYLAVQPQNVLHSSFPPSCSFLTLLQSLCHR